MKIDAHNHTTYSPDGVQTPEELVRAALEKGVGFLCVTEHLDNGYPRYAGENFDFRVTKQYFADFNRLREKYKDQIEILIGVEVGWTAENENDNALDLCKFPYEYVINSIHVVDGDDVYRPEYYKSRGKKKSYEEYLDAVFASLFAAYDYDAVGHLGYVARYADFEDNRLLYKDFSRHIDDILRIIIEKGKILEVNASTGKSGSLTMPDISVVERYRELGGRSVAYGSDSHYASRFQLNYDKIAALVKAAGFDSWTIKRDGGFVKVKI